ncbi:MAG: hypothetical protein JJE45_02320 [Prolixibacteraceae bacterium]|nr:hypothetical protein [Prolixibacteraceae bacterium]
MKQKETFKIEIIILILSVILVSCQNNRKTEEIISSISKTDSCTLYTEHHYEVYIPKRIKIPS